MGYAAERTITPGYEHPGFPSDQDDPAPCTCRGIGCARCGYSGSVPPWCYDEMTTGWNAPVPTYLAPMTPIRPVPGLTIEFTKTVFEGLIASGLVPETPGCVRYIDIKDPQLRAALLADDLAMSVDNLPQSQRTTCSTHMTWVWLCAELHS